MSLVPIENVNRVGVIYDVLPHEIPPEGWSFAQNIRFSRIAAEKFTGHKIVYTGTAVAPYWVTPWLTDVAHYWVYAGLAKIYRVTGTTHTDITRYTTTPGDDDYAAGTATVWSGGVFNGVPILNNNSIVDPPQQWDSALGRMKDLDNWPATYFCNVIGFYKNFVIAMDLTIGSVHYPQLVKWSDIADPGTVPGSWDHTDPTKSAGEQPLAEVGGSIIFGKQLGDVFVIYKEQSAIGMQFIGGQAIFRFYTMFSDLGILAPHCVVNYEKKHFVVMRGDIRLHNGQISESIIDKKNRDWLFNNIDPTYYQNTFVTVNRNASEIWVCYPAVGSTAGHCDNAAVWNWVTNTWGHRVLPDIRYAAYDIIDTSGESEIIDDDLGIIDDDFSIIDQKLYNPTILNVLMCGTADTLLYAADETNTFNGTAPSVVLEREGIAIVGRDREGNAKIDLGRVKFVRRVYPKMQSTGAVDIYVGGQEDLGGAVSWSGPFSFNPNTDHKIDCMVQGKFIGFKITSSTDVNWKLYGYTLDMEVLGESTL